MDSIVFFQTTTLFALCLWAVYIDIRTGSVPNKPLLFFSVVGIVLNAICFFAQGDLTAFFQNCLVCIVIAAVLFFTGTWAGGDCKLMMTICVTYPMSRYVSYAGSPTTLLFIIAVAFVIGYFYLIVDSIIQLCRLQTHAGIKQIGAALKSYLISYLKIMPSILLTEYIYIVFASKWIELSNVSLTALYMIIALTVDHYPLLTSLPLEIAVVIGDAVFFASTKVLPLSSNLFNYGIILLLIVLRVMMSHYNYAEINTSEVEKGMILSMGTSLLFERSKIEGLPGISSENLKSRLTYSEAASVRQWGESKHGQKTVIIVRKIPFATFISVGCILYYFIWELLPQ